MAYRIIKGQRIRKYRGERSLETIAKASGGAFSDSALLKWERDQAHPTLDNLRLLLHVLGCTYEDISEPVSLDVEAI